jgi:hypothetical protein
VAIAVRNNDAEALDILLENSAGLIEERTVHQNTPLLLACRWGRMDALRSVGVYHHAKLTLSGACCGVALQRKCMILMDIHR